MKSLDLTYKLITLKINSKTFDRIYFMSQVFQEHSHCYEKKKKNKKMKTKKIYLLLLPPLLSQDGGGGGLLQPPTPQFFSRQKFLKSFCIDTWLSGQRVAKLTVRQS